MNSELLVPYKYAWLFPWAGIVFSERNGDIAKKVLQHLSEIDTVFFPEKDEILERIKSEPAPGDSEVYVTTAKEFKECIEDVFCKISEKLGTEIEETPLAMSLQILKNSSEEYVLRFLPEHNFWTFYLYKYRVSTNGEKNFEKRKLVPVGAVEHEDELFELDLIYITDAINDIFASHGMGAVFE